VQVLELPPIPVVDLVIESDESDDEVEVLEPPPIPVIDLVTDNEDEVVPPSTLPLGEVVPIDTREDSEDELELLRELDGLDLSWEESRESARVRSKKVVAWGKVQRIAKKNPSRDEGEPPETQRRV
jgi:hypothetical protein